MYATLRSYWHRWTGMTEINVLEDPGPVLGSRSADVTAHTQATGPVLEADHPIASAARRTKRSASAPAETVTAHKRAKPAVPRPAPTEPVADRGAGSVEASSDSAQSDAEPHHHPTPDAPQHPCLPSGDSPSPPQDTQPLQGFQPGPHHHQQHLGAHHHDALEEQVFSPSFHIHHDAPAAASAERSKQGTPKAAHQERTCTQPGALQQRPSPRRSPRRQIAPPGRHSPPPSDSQQQQQDDQQAAPALAATEVCSTTRPPTATTSALAGPSAAATLPIQPPHAIDLNVVEGVDAEGGPPSARRQAPGDADAAAAAGILSNGDGLAAEGEDLGDEAYDDFEGDSCHDENAYRVPPPQTLSAAAPHAQQQQRAGAAGDGSCDNVLVASAPRALAPAGPDEDDGGDGEDNDDDEDYLEFDPLLFIKLLPPLESCVPPHRASLLPRQTRACHKRKTLVLDLDETLVHSSLEAVDRADFSFPVAFNGADHMVFVRQRPHLHDFMERVAALFEVVVFTASQKIYAEKLLNILDPSHTLVKYRIYRDSCVVVDGNYLKDLSILGRDLAHTVIVDNSPQAFGFQVDNGIPIESWYDDDADKELLRLLPFLEGLVDVDDVRPCVRMQFRLHEMIEQAGQTNLTDVR